MCKGTHGLPTTLKALGYVPEAVETTFANSQDRNVSPDLIIASAQIQHTVMFEWKSGANTEADQLQRYSQVAAQDLSGKAYIHVNKCRTHDVSIIARDEHRATIPIGVQNGGYTFPVMVTTATGMEIILNQFSNQPTDAVFRPLTVDWATLPTHFFPLDADSELWEFAEQAMVVVFEEMGKGATRIDQNTLGRVMFKQMWDRMSGSYKGVLKQKIQQVMDQASRGQFSKHLQRNTTARGVTQGATWDVIDNPLNAAADKRMKAWKAMLKKQKDLIEYFKDAHRQEFLELEGGGPIA